MNRSFLPALLAAGALTAAAPAFAQGWQDIQFRQTATFQRIDEGVRSGALTAPEALALRNEFVSLVGLENRYRADGLNAAEQADLTRRLDVLNAKIRVQANDRQTANNNGRPWQSIDSRQAMLDQRIDMGMRNGTLTRDEAARLRNEFRGIAATEASYRVDGLSPAEIADLDRRFDSLSAKIRVQAGDSQQRWESIDERQARLDARIEGGVRNGSLTPPEAQRLRNEFRELEALEARYRVGGLTSFEQRDLDRRFDTLSAQIRYQAADREVRR